MIHPSQLRPLFKLIQGSYQSFEPTEERAAAWCGLLDGHPIEEVHAAVLALLRKAGQWAPTPGDVIDEIKRQHPEQRVGASDISLIEAAAETMERGRRDGWPTLDEMLDWQDNDPERWMAWQDEGYELEATPGTEEYRRFQNEDPQRVQSRREWRAFDRARFKIRHGLELTNREYDLIEEALTVRKSRHYRNEQLLGWLEKSTLYPALAAHTRKAHTVEDIVPDADSIVGSLSEYDHE